MPTEQTPGNDAPAKDGAPSRKPWRAPKLILAEAARVTDRITNQFPTDNHTGASLITGQS